MSMISHMRHVTPDELKRLQANPKSVREFLHGKALAMHRAEFRIQHGRCAGTSHKEDADGRTSLVLLYTLST